MACHLSCLIGWWLLYVSLGMRKLSDRIWRAGDRMQLRHHPKWDGQLPESIDPWRQVA